MTERRMCLHQNNTLSPRRPFSAEKSTKSVSRFFPRMDMVTTSTRHVSIRSSTTEMATPIFFSTFEVTRQAFHRTALAYVIVNLKPIVPGRMRWLISSFFFC